MWSALNNRRRSGAGPRVGAIEGLTASRARAFLRRQNFLLETIQYELKEFHSYEDRYDSVWPVLQPHLPFAGLYNARLVCW